MIAKLIGGNLWLHSILGSKGEACNVFSYFGKYKNIFIFFPIYLDSTFLLHGFNCTGFMMDKMVLRELMDPSIFMKFNSFLTTVCFNHPLKNISFGKVIVFINWYFMSSMSCIFKILEIWIQENDPSCLRKFLLPFTRSLQLEV